MTAGRFPPVVPLCGAADVSGMRTLSVNEPPSESEEIGVGSAAAGSSPVWGASELIGVLTGALSAGCTATSSPRVADRVLNSAELGICCVPQFPQKCSPGETREPQTLHSTIYLTMWKRRNVFPTMISSPSHSAWRCPGGKRFPRLTNVPFVDPKSSRKYWPLRKVIRA